jgi:RNA polymerase sigma factor (sigma-70 family)
LTFLKNISSATTDRELIDQYKTSGKPEVLGEPYQRYMELVYGVCLKYFKEPEDAKDCVMTIYEELTSKLKKHEVENFKGWLYQLAKNHCLMKLRKKKIIPVNIDVTTVQSEENLHLSDAFEKEENFRQMEFCLSQLGAEQRQAVELFYLQNKCYKEIAETTGLDVNKVRSFIQNGRRNLKLCMQKQMEIINGITTT